jgi:hypothetical protein
MWSGIQGLLDELKKCEEAELNTAGLALAFICLDTMAYLAMAEDRPEQTKRDFLAFVEAYLRADPRQPYQYVPMEVYAARCAVLHRYGSAANAHRRDGSLRQFAYTDGGMHMVDPEAPNLVLIGLRSFFSDVAQAVGRFLEVCQADPEVCARAERRLSGVLRTRPIPTP